MTRHRRPEAEIAFVNGIMELLSDDPSRAREILASITPEAFVVDHAAEALAALTDTLTEIDTPGPADLLATVRRRPRSRGRRRVHRRPAPRREPAAVRSVWGSTATLTR